MAANMTVVTNLLNGRRVGRFANRKTLNNDETIQEAIDGGYVVGENVDFNGFGLATGDGDALRWSVPGTEKSGTVESARIESSWTRLTVVGDEGGEHEQ